MVLNVFLERKVIKISKKCVRGLTHNLMSQHFIETCISRYCKVNRIFIDILLTITQIYLLDQTNDSSDYLYPSWFLIFRYKYLSIFMKFLIVFQYWYQYRYCHFFFFTFGVSVRIFLYVLLLTVRIHWKSCCEWILKTTWTLL